MPDPDQVRQRLCQAGARPGFAGMMIDVRYDRNGELAARDQVLRLRRFRSRLKPAATCGCERTTVPV